MNTDDWTIRSEITPAAPAAECALCGALVVHDATVMYRHERWHDWMEAGIRVRAMRDARADD